MPSGNPVQMKSTPPRSFVAALALAALGLCLARPSPLPAAPAQTCPQFGWSEGLGKFLQSDFPFPTNDTENLDAPDCAFHQWSWEAFTWATALVTDPASGSVVPRFMTLSTPADLQNSDPSAGKPRLRPLKLAARSHLLQGAAGFTEGAGAIVEADGNMLVAPNGYPVYASVHMNESYFNTARQNLIVDGGYMNQPPDAFFAVGAAVFKATWLRLDPGQTPPAGTYTTQAEVPVLATTTSPGTGTGPGTITIAPVPGKFTTVTVALVGLHVVGYTVNHPEFLWGTFEHKLNSPATPDNTFPGSGSSPYNYTFYKANTPFSQANQAFDPPVLKLNAATQRLTPVTSVVLENQTGGENHPDGAGNIAALNTSAQGFFAGLKPPQAQFGSYNLIGTVWMQPNSYNLTSNQANATGSINLANATAETFVQTAKNKPVINVTNCFLCHNPTSYSFQTPPPAKLAPRLIALSHVLSAGSVYAVPNSISGSLLTQPADAK